MLEPSAAVLLPALPEVQRPAPFPLAATLAPVAVSLVLWAVTRSPFALMFALLAPVVALASIVDARVVGRRRRRAEGRRFLRELQEVRTEIEDRHRAERAAIDAVSPGIRPLLVAAFSSGGELARWHDDRDVVSYAPLGRGSVRSALPVQGHPAGRPTRSRLRRSLDEVARDASVLSDAAVVLDPRRGVGFVGPPVVASAAGRAFVVRLAAELDPSRWRIVATTAGSWDWLASLPHQLRADGAGEDVDIVEFLGGTDASSSAERITVAVASSASALPRRCRLIVRVRSGSARLHAPAADTTHDPVDDRIRLEFVSIGECEVAARRLRDTARREGIITSRAALPGSLMLTALGNAPAPEPRPPAVGLPVEIGAGESGALVVDIASDGPHAVVGGTTGSGKSELLTTWIVALATRYSPREVVFLLVDFKGGAAFGSVAALPHTAGVVTDLDAPRARRALESLRAEVRYRERTLLDARARSIEELPAAVLPRLLIVVDEFAALSADFPELHQLFADLAARGRSLGVHLILCTQRPAASVRDAVLANCTLRICLRVNDAADSVALIGSSAAADLPRDRRGRAYLAMGSGVPSIVQIALADPREIDRVGRAVADAVPVRVPWCEPLPEVLPFGSLPPGRPPPDGELVFGMVDRPAEQRQVPLAWNPERHGNLIVVGAERSGRTATLAALAEAGRRTGVGVIGMPRGIEAAWDLTAALVDGSMDAGTKVLLLIDDLDLLADRFPPDHRAEFVDRVVRLLRHGKDTGVTCAVAVRTTSAAMLAVAAACADRLLLRAADRSEHVLSGGAGAEFDQRMPPGGGFRGGDRVQVALVEDAAVEAHPDPRRFGPSALQPGPRPRSDVDLPGELKLCGVTAVISSAPHEFAAAVGRLSRPPVLLRLGVDRVDPAATSPEAGRDLVIVGDLDAWQSQWGTLPALRATAPVVFHRCAVADYRAITRTRSLPPVLSSPDHLWVLGSDDSLTRARIPRDGQASTSASSR